MNSFSTEITFNDQVIEEIRKLTTGQGENYTSVRLLDYELIKNHKLVGVDLNRQKLFSK